MTILLAFAIPLLIIAGLVAGGVALARRIRGDESGGSGITAVRRFVSYLFGYGLAVVTAVGLAQIVAILIPGETIAGRGSGDVARGLAMTVVGAPAFLLLWSWLRRKLDTDPTERASLGWTLFLLAGHVTFLIGGLVGLANGIEWLFGLDESGRTPLAFGLVWTAAWWWFVIKQRGSRAPTTLSSIAPLAGSLIALSVSAGALGFGLARLLEEAYDRAVGTAIGATGLGEDLGQALVWLALAGGAWWFHWLGDARRQTATSATYVYLLVVGVLGGAVAALTATGTLVYTVLEFIFTDPDVTAATHFSEVGSLLSGIAVGAIVWRYHRLVVTEDPRVFETEAGRAYRYLFAGVGLVAAASGLGVIVNAALEALVVPLAQQGRTTESFLSGLVALGIGLPVWWRTWSPSQARGLSDDAEITSTSRRVYLTSLAGIGGVVSVVTLIVLLFRLFEGILESNRAAAIVDDVSGPLGLVVATAVVAGYHLVVWRRDRERVGATEPEVRLERVVLVAADPDTLSGAIGAATGARVVGWRRADQDGDADPNGVVEALRGVRATRVLVIVGTESVETIPLVD